MTKHTDTSLSGDLVERLREGVLYGDARLRNPKGHDPLRIEAACQYHRSQHKNRLVVQEMIEWALTSCNIKDTTHD